MMRLGIDLDGVVSMFIAGLRGWFANTTLPVNEMPDPDRFEMWECWGLTYEQWRTEFDKAAVAGLFHQLKPHEGAVEGLRKLHAAGHSIHIITSREHPAAQTSTIGWLNAEEIPYTTLTFSVEKGGFPVDLMLEDNADYARIIADAGVHCVLMTRRWNETAEGFDRVSSWDEFVDYVEQYEFGAHPGEVRKTSPTGGQKGAKPETYSMIPVRSLAEVARVYNYGAGKYERDNWRRGYDFSLSYDALQRHLNDFWDGENINSESGLHHLAHAVFHCFALLVFSSDKERYGCYDNRSGCYDNRSTS